MGQTNGQLEEWKTQLILEIARRKGFKLEELHDAQQQVAMQLMKFKYDAVKAGGAPERVIWITLIEKKLAMLQRSEHRRRQHEKKVRRVCGKGKFEPITDTEQLRHEHEFELGLDVREVVATLNAMDRTVCVQLAQGASREDIAAELGTSRYEVDRAIERLTEIFAAKNLNTWVRE